MSKELWAFTDNRISVRFECEWQHIKSGQWYRSHGNEHWEFDANGFMNRRDMSANDVLLRGPIRANEQRIRKQKNTSNHASNNHNERYGNPSSVLQKEN